MAEADFCDLPEEPEICKYCNKHLKSKNMLRKHIENVHRFEDDAYNSAENQTKKKPRIISDLDLKESDESNADSQSTTKENSPSVALAEEDVEDEDETDEDETEDNTFVKEQLDEKMKHLKAILKENFSRYLHQLRLFFTGVITKEEFDDEVRQYFTFETIIAHNQFFLEFVRGIRSVAANTSTAVSGYYNQTNCNDSEKIVSKTTGQKAENGNNDGNTVLNNDKEATKTEMDNLSGSPTPKVTFESAPLHEYLSSAPPRFYGCGVRECTPNKACLPDLETMYALMFITAWENDLQIIDRRALPVMVEAVEIHVRRIISAVLMRKNAYRSNDSSVIHNFLNGKSLKQASLKSMPCEKSTTKLSKEKEPISLHDLLDALQVYPNAISFRSLYLLAIEKIINRLSVQELKTPALGKKKSHK